VSKRESLLYLTDAVEAAEAIEAYWADLTFETFVCDRKTYSATIREYIVIGEAIAKTYDLLVQTVPDFPWRAVKDFRNIVVYEYFGVDPRMVWDLSTQELPQLKDHLVKMIEKLQDDS